MSKFVVYVVIMIILIFNSCNFLPKSYDDFLPYTKEINPGKIEIYCNGNQITNGGTLDFQTVTAGGGSLSRPIEIINNGTGVLEIEEITLFGVLYRDWYIFYDDYEDFPILITPNDSYEITIKFTPQSTGIKSSNDIHIESNAIENGDFEIILWGEGI